MVLVPANLYIEQHFYASYDDDDTNSTCAQYTSCTPCLDYLGTTSDEGCLWCNVPKDAAAAGQGGLCLQRSKAQDRCQIGQLEASCSDGVGWYVLVLTLCALLCCCCFLTMARKFVAVWHERRWIAAGGQLTHPLLDEEDGEEQAHEAVIRSSLVDAEGTSWRCPVCGFDNRPLCKHCDLCGISSEFAEAYWKDKNTPPRKGCRNKRSRPPRIGNKVSSSNPWSPSGPANMPGELEPSAAMSGAVDEDGRSTFAQDGSVAGEDTNEPTGNERGHPVGDGREGDGEEESESESESAPLLRRGVVTLVPAVPARVGSIQGDSAGDVPNDGENSGEYEWGRALGTSVTDYSEKSRATTFRLPRAGTLTERQKRARRRRVWQRVIGADGKVYWMQTLESPAKIAPSPAFPSMSLSSSSSSSSTIAAYQPPSVVLADATAATAAGGRGVEAGAEPASISAQDGEATSGGTGGTSSAALTNAAAVLRYWTTSRARSRRLHTTPPETAASDESGVGSSAIAADTTPAGGAAAVASPPAESLSDVERGEGRSLPPQRGQEGAVIAPRPGGSRSASSSSLSFAEEGRRGGGTGIGQGKDKGSASTPAVVSLLSSEASVGRRGEESKMSRSDSFGDETMITKTPGYYTTFLEGGGLAWDEARDGEEVVRPNPLPPSATRRGPTVGEGSSSSETIAGSGAVGGISGGGAGTGPSARRSGWGDGAARRREARREEAASEEWVNTTRADVAKLCEIASRPFWQKHSWFLDQLRLLQVPHGAGMEAMRIEVHRNNLLEDSFSQVSAMNTGELRRWLRVQFVGEPGVDAGGLEREWFFLVCRALFDPSTGLFAPQPGNGAFAINPSSGVANDMHLEYFRFTGRVLGKLLMEHSVAPYHLSLPILKHLLSLPLAFSDLEFADAELHRNLDWLRANPGTSSLGLDFTVTLESFGVKEVAELRPGGREVAVTDENKEEYLKLRLKHRMLGGIHDQLWHLMRGFYDVIPSHLISVFDYQELELLLCGIPEIDVAEWKRHSRYIGDYRRNGEDHQVIKWFWEVVEAFSEEEKARFLQFCTGTSRLPPHGFKALQSNDGSFRAFSLQSILKRDSAFPRAHTCFNKLDLPVYDTKKELEECLRLCICFELTGFTID